MSLIIRQMAKEDREKVQDVAHKSWHATYEGIIPYEIQENFLKVAYSNEMMEHRRTHSLILVAEVEKNIVGFANFSSVNNSDEVELNAIYIYPDHEGKGIGTALLREGIALSKGVRKMYIDVEKDNEIGRRFYIAKGFSTVDEYDDDFDGHLLKTVRMVLQV